MGRWFEPSSGSQFSSGCVVGGLSRVSVLWPLRRSCLLYRAGRPARALRGVQAAETASSVRRSSPRYPRKFLESIQGVPLNGVLVAGREDTTGVRQAALPGSMVLGSVRMPGCCCRMRDVSIGKQPGVLQELIAAVT